MSDEPVTAILNEISSRLGGLEQGQAALLQEQISLRTDVTTMRTDVTTMRTDLTTMRTDLTTMRTDVTTVRVDLMERMDRLGDQITSIREDIGVNMESVDQVRQVGDSTKEELRALGNVVYAMNRQVRRLQAQVDELTGRPFAP